MPRHDFSVAVKRQLALRAAHFCTNPLCLRLTAGPGSNLEKGLGTGHAAHICAASKLGPRYDENQTEAERRSANNGIWLCRECGDMVDKDEPGFPVDKLRAWKCNHEAMIAEVRQQGWSKSIELLRSNSMSIDLARRIIVLFEDRRVFWASFDAEFPDRVRMSLEQLRANLSTLRRECAPEGSMDKFIVALLKTIRHFFNQVEHLDLTKLQCDGGNSDWLFFEMALRTLRKSVGYQIGVLANSYSISLQGELAESIPTPK